MPVLTIVTDTVGQVDVNPRRVKIITTDNLITVLESGYLNEQVKQGYILYNTDIVDMLYSYDPLTQMGFYGIFTISIIGSNGITLSQWADTADVLFPVVSGNVVLFSGIAGQLKDSGGMLSHIGNPFFVMSPGAVTIGNIPLFNDINGTLADSKVSASNIVQTSGSIRTGHLVSYGINAQTIQDSGVIASLCVQSSGSTTSGNIVSYGANAQIIQDSGINASSVVHTSGSTTNGNIVIYGVNSQTIQDGGVNVSSLVYLSGSLTLGNLISATSSPQTIQDSGISATSVVHTNGTIIPGNLVSYGTNAQIIQDSGINISSIAQNDIVYASSANSLSGISTGDNQVLLTNASGIPIMGSPGSNLTISGGIIDTVQNITTSSSPTFTQLGLAGLAPAYTLDIQGSRSAIITVNIAGTQTVNVNNIISSLYVNTNFVTTTPISRLSQIYVQGTINATSGAISQAYGIYIDSGNSGSSGTISSAYGLVVQTPTYGSSNYCSFFSGNVGIGNPTPSYPLDIGGIRNLSVALSISGIQTATATHNSIYIGNTYVIPTSGTANVTDIYIKSNINLGMSATVPRAVSIYIDATTNTSGGLITNAYGLYVAKPTIATVANYAAYFGGVIQLSATNCFTANGSVATAFSGVGPTGSHTSIQTWLTVLDDMGNTRYVPCF